MPVNYKDHNEKEKNIGESKRKDTGRTDKYSNETPRKDYKDYRTDYPKAGEDARAKALAITKRVHSPQQIGVKSIETRKQELTSHIQNYQETFNNQESKAWKNILRELLEELEIRS